MSDDYSKLLDKLIKKLSVRFFRGEPREVITSANESPAYPFDMDAYKKMIETVDSIMPERIESILVTRVVPAGGFYKIKTMYSNVYNFAINPSTWEDVKRQLPPAVAPAPANAISHLSGIPIIEGELADKIAMEILSKYLSLGLFQNREEDK